MRSTAGKVTVGLASQNIVTHILRGFIQLRAQWHSMGDEHTACAPHGGSAFLPNRPLTSTHCAAACSES